MRVLLLVVVFVAGSTPAAAQGDPLQDAIAALQRGDTAGAERTLRAELKSHPDNADALGILAVVLDQEKKYPEADQAYRQALQIAPRSAPLLNNYGNHLMATGKLEPAREVFLRVLAVNPVQPNALLQSARVALERKQSAEALRYLDRLPSDAQQNPDAEIVRMQALYTLHRDQDASSIFNRVSMSARNDPRLAYTLGGALAAAGRSAQAEDILSRGLELAPDNFQILYSLGLAASHAGHNERARDVLESAHRREPQNEDVLYDLAAVQAALGQRETAVQLLVNASRLAPDRPDIEQLLARTTADLGYFGDAIEAWDRYLKLVPGDAVARRERAFDATANGQDMQGGIAALKAYAGAHPRDPIGLYELAVAEATTDPGDALARLDRALNLKPDLTAAQIARGLIRFKQGEFDRALPDFEAAAKREPQNAVLLDRLGQTYMALDRSSDTIPVLRKAAELAPRDSKTLLHLGRALAGQGHSEEAAALFARFRDLGPDRSALPRDAGLLDFLSLPKQEQMARYRAGVERTAQRDPANAEAQVRYLKLLLDDGKPAEASEVSRHLLNLKASAPLLEEASAALLAAHEYSTARDFAEKAVALRPTPELMLDLALATSHAASPQAGLERLDRISLPQRTGNYYIVRASLLDAAARHSEAASTINKALTTTPSRAELYPFAVSLLLRNHRVQDAIALLERGIRASPDNPDLTVLRAIALQSAGRAADADHAFTAIENRWPDWYKVWLAHAIFAAMEGHETEANQMLETASALGAPNAREQLAEAGKFRSDSTDAAAVHLIDLLFQ